ncbi:MAG: Hsp20 family protein [Candidatus Aenigmarchaeota archaeon]|nr:Hsp20 family protein [Candidatus Aenigmarchaeota archaeon]
MIRDSMTKRKEYVFYWEKDFKHFIDLPVDVEENSDEVVMRITLPEGIDSKKLDAFLEKNVLTVKMAKKKQKRFMF